MSTSHTWPPCLGAVSMASGGDGLVCRWRLLLGALSLLVLMTPAVTSFGRVCYLRPDFMLPVDLVLHLDLCTHLIVGFTSVDSSSRIQRDDHLLSFCQRCKQLIHKNGSQTKLMFSIGGIFPFAPVVPTICFVVYIPTNSMPFCALGGGGRL